MTTNNSINGAIKVTEFTSNGTWTKDLRAHTVEVIMWGGGSGGGSGSRSAAGIGRPGGGGGGVGGYLHYFFPADKFSASEAVVIGTGGAGGAAQTVDTTPGNDGTAGTVSSIGSVVSTQAPSVGGEGGFLSGPTSGGQPGPRINDFVHTPSILGTGLTYAGRGAGANAAGGGTAGSFPCGPTGGGGGGGIDVSNVINVPSAGGDCEDFKGTLVIAGGTAGSGAGNNADGTEVFYTGGSGGGGGVANDSGAAGTGGVGGTPGGGGGGGGASLNGHNSGAGGAGGDGKVIIREHLN